MTTANPILTPEDLYEGVEEACDRGCPHKKEETSTVPTGVVVERLKINAREIAPSMREPLDAIAEASEPLDAVAEPLAASDMRPMSKKPSSICMPWVRIERDPARMKACMQLANQLGRIESSKQLYEIIRGQLEREDQECYYVIALDTQLMLRGIAEVARGGRDRVLTPIQDTVRYSLAFAQLYGAQSIAIAHNHPSGKIKPSDADKDVTKAVEKACAANDIMFMDHLIVGISGSNGEPGYYSFRDAGALGNNR